MKSLKVLLIAATVSSANIALAQESQAVKPATTQTDKKVYATPEQHATNQTARITGVCGLSADQQAKVKAIYLQSDEAIQTSNKTAGKDKAKAKEEKTKLVQARRKQLDAVLTPDQKIKFDAATKANGGVPLDEK